MSDSESEIESVGSEEEASQRAVPEIPFVLIVAGMRKSGKTTLILNLLYEDLYGLFDKVYIFCSTFWCDPQFRVIRIPEGQVFTEYNDTYVMRLIQNAINDPRPEEEKPRILLICDDVVGDSGFKRGITSKGMNGLAHIAMRGRHHNISTIILSQTVTGISPEVRKNVDSAIIFATTNEQELEAVFESFGFGKRRQWLKLFMACTSDPRSFYMYHPTSQYWDRKVFKNFTAIPIKFS